MSWDIYVWMGISHEGPWWQGWLILALCTVYMAGAIVVMRWLQRLELEAASHKRAKDWTQSAWWP